MAKISRYMIYEVSNHNLGSRVKLPDSVIFPTTFPIGSPLQHPRLVKPHYCSSTFVQFSICSCELKDLSWKFFNLVQRFSQLSKEFDLRFVLGCKLAEELDFLQKCLSNFEKYERNRLYLQFLTGRNIRTVAVRL